MFICFSLFALVYQIFWFQMEVYHKTVNFKCESQPVKAYQFEYNQILIYMFERMGGVKFSSTVILMISAHTLFVFSINFHIINKIYSRLQFCTNKLWQYYLRHVKFPQFVNNRSGLSHYMNFYFIFLLYLMSLIHQHLLKTSNFFNFANAK